jgi:hypothetical protein
MKTTMGEDESGGTMEASEWAQQKAQSIHAARAADEIRTALNLERQRIRTSNFPDLVEAVARAFQHHCEEYNKIRAHGERSVEFHAIGPSLYMLRRDAGLSEINMRVNLSSCTIRVTAERSGLRYDRVYHPEALANGTALLSSSNGGSLVRAEDVAQEAMDAFLDGQELAERL